MQPTVEDGLRAIAGRAALLSALAQAANDQSALDESAWNGLEDVCEEIVRVAEQIRRALSARALGEELGRAEDETEEDGDEDARDEPQPERQPSVHRLARGRAQKR